MVGVSENARRLKELRERAGYTVRGFARLIGWGHTRYQYYEDVIKTKYLPAEFVELISPFLLGKGIPPITSQEVASLAGAIQIKMPTDPVQTIPPPNATFALEAPRPLPQRQGMKKDLPVLGTSAGGRSGDFTMNGEVVDYLLRPPALEHRKDVFVVYVDGISMVPWRQPREPVVAETKSRPLIGDHVVIELKPDRDGEPRDCYVKKLVRRTATKLVVAQYNPPQEIEFPMSKVLNIYRAMEWHEILMV